MLIKVRSCNLKLEEQMHASYTNYNFTIEKCNASIYADSLELCLTEKGSMDFLFEIALQSLIIFHFDDVFPPSLNRDVFAAFRGKEKGWRFNSIYVLVNCVRKLTRRDSLWMDKGRCLLLFCFGLC
jgi:hypothetical protein